MEMRGALHLLAILTSGGQSTVSVGTKLLNIAIYYPTLLRRLQITRETTTNITRYLYSSHSPDRANY